MNTDRLLCKARIMEQPRQGQWITGYYVHTNLGKSVHAIRTPQGVGYLVDPSTICQAAPKTISMKTPVFENDLIEMMGETYKVKLLCDHWILRLMNTDEDAYLCLSTIGFDYKVVGNAFDNKEENQ